MQAPAHEILQGDCSFGEGVFFAKPLIRLTDAVVVALPHSLVPALNHALLSAFLEAGQRDALLTSVGGSVKRSVVESLDWLGIERVAVELPEADPVGLDGAVLPSTETSSYMRSSCWMT